MNIFVTGAGGFIGKNFIDYATKNGCKIFAVSRKANIFSKNKNVKVLKGNFYDNWIKEMRKCEVLIHFASTGVIEKETIEKCMDINVNKSYLMLLNAIKANCLNWVIVSSSSEYGETLLQGNAVGINDTPLPSTNYGISKSIFTNIAIDLAKKYKAKCRLVRLFQVYGEGESNKRLYKIIIKSAKNNKPIILNNPNERRDFSDVAIIKIKFLEMCKFKKSRRFIKPEIWHLASGNVYSIYDFTRNVYKKYNSDVKVIKKIFKGKLYHHISNEISIWNKFKSKL
jgi:nucleoside-diphosphate-sugar epimerase